MVVIPSTITGINTTNIGSGYGNGNISSNAWVHHNDYHIQGKMLTVNLVIADWEMNNKPIQAEEIKYRLANEMVKKMVEDNHMEFTKMLDPHTGEHKFHARIFVVPDTQVRILRENKVATTGPW